ncbi:MAG: rod shape-determining protein RodA [Actinomycetota bacterium]
MRGLTYEAPLGRIGRVARANKRPLTEKAPIRHLDATLVITAFMLAAFGNLMVYSASRARLQADGQAPTALLNRQIFFSIVGIAVMAFMASFSYRRLKAWGPIAYAGGLISLLAVLSPLGSTAKGAQRWINLGPLQFQPSEFMKIAVLIVVALLLSNRRGDVTLGTIATAGALVIVPAVLIYKQPDLGTLLVLIATLVTLLVVSGTRALVLIAILIIGVVGVYGVFHLGVLKDYQRERLTAFLDPSADTQRTGYNLNQARIGVGSGEVFGKGLFKGSQTNLAFVPEVHTDFIFVAIGEETGFVGSLFLLTLFAILLWRGIRIAMMSKDLFGTLLAAGVVAMLAFQMFVNIGMTIGVSPITGIPLPFVSYGGSSMITSFAASGLMLNVHMRRLI